ncbi:hypothetical protein TeGR_g14511, partial [Tetraparma gracilis]
MTLPLRLLPLLLLLLLRPSLAVLPTDQIQFSSPSSPDLPLFYASTAGFGVAPSASISSDLSVSLTPPSEYGLCEDLDSAADPSFVQPGAPFLMLVPRGNCTFQQKTLRAQQYGASAVAILNAEASLYDRNGSFPLPQADYECGNGEAWVPEQDLAPPYWSAQNDAALEPCSSASSCASDRCVLTGEEEGGSMKACCAWDLHQYLYASADLANPSIPAVFVTMAQGDEILALVESESGGLTATMLERPRPKYNASSVIIWAVGVFVSVLASYISSADLKEHVD